MSDATGHQEPPLTIRHATLGAEGGLPVVGFDFAREPSCAYDPRWHLPSVKVEPDERAYGG
ncbi:MAG: hypothetical protein M3151_02120 [Actinomycetota bacterium]|nr:hypothetical protein [Actinomycetota bacterium]